MPKRKHRSSTPSLPQSRGNSRASVESRRAQRRGYDERAELHGDPEQPRPRASRSRQSARRTSMGRDRRRRSSSLSRENARSPKVRQRYDSDTINVIEKIMTAMKDFESNNSNERYQFPILNNVIPEFNPLCKEQSIDSWLNKVEECGQIYGWNEKHMIHYALPKLTGIAKSWYQGLPTLLYSWAEWKNKLKESFPCRQNYAELLTEMLQKKVRFGESLELYYYSKINLLNRCEITGKRAVDCLVFGIDDRSVRLGAQAAEFKDPNQVLNFLKTIKVGHNKTTNETTYKDKRVTSEKPKTSTTFNNTTTHKENLKCYNCNEKGHTYIHCSKPKLQCTNCKLIGHTINECPKIKPTKKENDQNIMKVETNGYTGSKYNMPIKVNTFMLNGYIDLGSEGTLIRLSDAKRAKLQFSPSDGPMLKGFGGDPYCPIGSSLCTIEIQGLIEKDVEILIVEDHLLNAPVLVGHTFTERPNIQIIKTSSDVIFQRTLAANGTKIPLICSSNIVINQSEIKAVPINCNTNYTGSVYVQGTLRGQENKEYYLLPGEYIITNGLGSLLIQNVCSNKLQFNSQTLITRSYAVNSETFRNINKIDLNQSCSDESLLKYGNNLTQQQKDTLIKLIDSYPMCFSTGLQNLGYSKETEMVIHLNDSEPVVYRPYRLSYGERQLVREMINEMLDSSIIRESNSPYASPIVLVNKKSGDKRLCVDYRALNRKTVREHYPIPRIEDQLDMLVGSTIFITLDLASGYYQIPIAESSREKTAFVTPDGQYEYCRMPFGLVNAPSVFQRTMNKIVQNSPVRSYVLLYMDDILIPAKSFEQSMKRLEEVLCVLKDSGLTLKLNKCNFCFEKIDYLGYEVSAEGVRPGSLKTEAISKFPVPKNVHEIRRFLGLASFFRRFVKGFAVIARPLTSLLKKDTGWKWETEEIRAFKTLQTCLVERPVLAIYNPKGETQLHTDASKYGVAGILLQKDQSDLYKPIAYYSRQTTKDEQKLHSFELETLAVIASLNKFRVYLLGIKFKIITDCNALRTT